MLRMFKISLLKDFKRNMSITMLIPVGRMDKALREGGVQRIEEG